MERDVVCCSFIRCSQWLSNPALGESSDSQRHVPRLFESHGFSSLSVVFVVAHCEY